jgi:hypothetical protein
LTAWIITKPSFPKAKGRTRLSYAISTEAVQEFQVGTSAFSAQYGRSAGGVVNAVTRSGANNLHGGFFYMIRDDSLNAANPLGGPQLIGLGLSPKPKVRRQQFGPSLGGPIKPDKLFYFVSYDQQKRTFPAVVIPYSSSFLTSSGTAPGYNNAVGFFQGMVGPQAREGNQWVGLSKVDWNASPRNQFSSTINILRWGERHPDSAHPWISRHGKRLRRRECGNSHRALDRLDNTCVPQRVSRPVGPGLRGPASECAGPGSERDQRHQFRHAEFPAARGLP